MGIGHELLTFLTRLWFSCFNQLFLYALYPQWCPCYRIYKKNDVFSADTKSMLMWLYHFLPNTKPQTVLSYLSVCKWIPLAALGQCAFFFNILPVIAASPTNTINWMSLENPEGLAIIIVLYFLNIHEVDCLTNYWVCGWAWLSQQFMLTVWTQEYLWLFLYLQAIFLRSAEGHDSYSFSWKMCDSAYSGIFSVKHPQNSKLASEALLTFHSQQSYSNNYPSWSQFIS